MNELHAHVAPGKWDDRERATDSDEVYDSREPRLGTRWREGSSTCANDIIFVVCACFCGAYSLDFRFSVYWTTMMDCYQIAYQAMIGACLAGAELFMDRMDGKKVKDEPPDIRDGEEEEVFFDAQEGEEEEEVCEEREEREAPSVVAILIAELDAVRAERDRLREQLRERETKSGTKRPAPAQNDVASSDEEAASQAAKRRRKTGGEEFFSAPPVQSSFVFKSKENVLEFENPFLVKEEMPKVPAFVGTAEPWCENREPTAEKEVPENPNKISDRPVEDTSLALVCVDKNSAPPPSSFHDDPFFSGEFAEGYGGNEYGASFHDDPFFQGEYAGYGEGQYAASFDDDPYYEGDYREEQETDSFDDDPFYEGDHAEEEDTDSFDDDPFYEGGSPEEDS